MIIRYLLESKYFILPPGDVLKSSVLCADQDRQVFVVWYCSPGWHVAEYLWHRRWEKLTDNVFENEAYAYQYAVDFFMARREKKLPPRMSFDAHLEQLGVKVHGIAL